MAASEIRRAIIGNIPDCLRNCVNKEYFMRSSTGAGKLMKNNNNKDLPLGVNLGDIAWELPLVTLF